MKDRHVLLTPLSRKSRNKFNYTSDSFSVSAYLWEKSVTSTTNEMAPHHLNFREGCLRGRERIYQAFEIPMNTIIVFVILSNYRIE